MSNVDHVSDANLRESLVLCEEENEKARRIILWCAERLPKEHILPLINMLKGSIVVDAAEEDREQLRKLLTAVTKLTDLIDETARLPMQFGVPEDFWPKLDAHANQVRGLVQELEQDLPPTLHEVRNGLLK